MAITHFTPQIISRGAGRSAVAAAAYRHCARMENEREASIVDYSRKRGLAHEEVILPQDAPAWIRDLFDGLSAAEQSEAFWNQLEAFETRKDAQLAKEFILALPLELTIEQNIELVRDYIGSNLASRGIVADWVYHDAAGNPHAHIMTCLRPLRDDGFGSKKVAHLNEAGEVKRSDKGQILYRLWAGSKDDFLELREAWYQAQNAHLARHGFDIRVDGRSYDERGLDLVATNHIGVAANHITDRGECTSHSDQTAGINDQREADLERLRLWQERRAENLQRITRRPEIVLEALSSEMSTFEERDVAKYLHRYCDDPALFASLMARILSSPETVLLSTETIHHENGELMPARYATRSMILLEATMARQAEHLALVDHEGAFAVDAIKTQAILASYSFLSDEQRVALDHLCQPNRLATLVGRAGAGKTSMMKVAREIWREAGYRVLGGALAGKAAEGLQKEAGIEARTLASWQLAWQKGRLLLDETSIFVLDEAGMVGSRQMADFVAAIANSGAKLVLIGDADQLQPIDAGAAFRALSDRVGYAELGTIYRQKQDWMRQASMDLARGKVEAALDAYGERGHVHGSALKRQAIGRLIADWLRDYDPEKSQLMLAHLRKDVRELNRLAREGLMKRGDLKPGSAFSTEDGVRDFASGDQIIFLQNDLGLGVKNGMLGTVISAKPGYLLIELNDDQRQVEIEEHFYRSLDWGYATTIHKSQGATLDEVKVLASLSMDRHLSYVALTRHRLDMQLYYGERSFDHVGGLAASLSQAGNKSSSLDHAGSDLYRKALAYAQNRGLPFLLSIKAYLANQRHWLQEQRSKLMALSKRLSQHLTFQQHDRNPTLKPDEVRAVLAKPTIAQSDEQDLRPSVPLRGHDEIWIRGLKNWPVSVEDEIHASLMDDKVLQASWRDLQDRLALVYEEPQRAITAMGLQAALSDPVTSQASALQSVCEKLVQDPAQYGLLNGRTGLLASRAQRELYQRARSNIPVLIEAINNHGRVRRELIVDKRLEIESDRARLSQDLMRPSEQAQTLLQALIAPIQDNDIKQIHVLLKGKDEIRQELLNLGTQIIERFGPRAFTPSNTGLSQHQQENLAKLVHSSDRAVLLKDWAKLQCLQALGSATQKADRARQEQRDRGRDQSEGRAR